MSSTTPLTDSRMRRADSMQPNAVVVDAPFSRGLESDLREATAKIAELSVELIAAKSAKIPEGLQPIETAPKDGTLILLCRNIGQVYRSAGQWTEHRGGYWTTDFAECVSDEAMMAAQPTHWMHLPAAPK